MTLVENTQFIYDFLSQLMKIETICRLALKVKASYEKLRMKKTLRFLITLDQYIDIQSKPYSWDPPLHWTKHGFFPD